MCSRRDHNRKGKMFWQPDSEDSDSVSITLPGATPKNARGVSNGGRFHGNVGRIGGRFNGSGNGGSSGPLKGLDSESLCSKRSTLMERRVKSLLHSAVRPSFAA
ncbi:hypothetical protein ACSQ67_009480 [Phaseolus vulgaris]